jgi:methionine-rich copper-binding protein CopC
MPRRCAVLALAAILCGMSSENAWAHAGLRASSPASGAALGDTPKAVQLTFWEKPEASLSEIRIFDTGGRAYQVGRGEAVAGSPLSLVVPVRPLERGVYTVSWRTISSIDGHATAGAFAFGVRMKPTGVAWASADASAAASPLEVVARWLLVVGLVLLLGAAAATVGRFGGTSDRMLGAGGWLLAATGLLLLAAAQMRNAGVSAAALLHTAIGRALLWRAVALAAAGGALLAAGSSRAGTAALRDGWHDGGRGVGDGCPLQGRPCGGRDADARGARGRAMGALRRGRDLAGGGWPHCCSASGARRRPRRRRPCADSPGSREPRC